MLDRIGDYEQMRIEVELPDTDIEGHAIEEATVSGWYVDEENVVEKGEDFIGIRVNVDESIRSVPSPATGRLLEKVAKKGDVVRAGDVIAIFDAEEELEDI